MLAPKHLSLLQALAEYKYLSRSQMARLGVEQYNSNYTTYCKPLLSGKLIGMIDARPYNLGLIYYITLKGAKMLAQHLQTDHAQMNYVKSPPSPSPQILRHRTYAINCQIALTLSCQQQGIDIEFYDRDIETLGSLKQNQQLQRKTRVALHRGQFLEPDGIFRISTPKGAKLYCFELENATYTKKSFEKIKKHIIALNLKSPSKKYNHDKAHRILMVYTDESIMHAVMHKMKQQLSNIKHWFLFKSYDQAITPIQLKKSTFCMDPLKDYFQHWKTIQGDKTSLF